MGFFHIIIEFEKDRKQYSFYKFDISSRELIEKYIKDFKNEETICLCGFKINTKIYLSRLRVFSSNEEFNKCKEKENNIYYNPYRKDVDLVKFSSLFNDITDDFKFDSLVGFNVNINKLK